MQLWRAAFVEFDLFEHTPYAAGFTAESLSADACVDGIASFARDFVID